VTMRRLDMAFLLVRSATDKARGGRICEPVHFAECEPFHMGSLGPGSRFDKPAEERESRVQSRE
jgi:hypothetical protein